MMIQPMPLTPCVPSAGRATRKTAVPTIAMNMPPADRRLPLRAVAGEFMRIRPMTNAEAPTSQASLTRSGDRVEVEHRQAPASSVGLGATGFLRNIWSIRSVTT